MLQKFHEGLLHDFIHDKACKGTLGNNGDTALAFLLVVFHPIGLGIVQPVMEIVIDECPQADARKFFRAFLVFGVETVMVGLTVVTIVRAGDTEKVAEGFERVAVESCIRVFLSFGKPIRVGFLHGFALQFRNVKQCIGFCTVRISLKIKWFTIRFLCYLSFPLRLTERK